MDDILTGIEDLQDQIRDLKIDLEVAEGQLALANAKAKRVPGLEAQVKALKAEITQLRSGRERAMQALKK